MEAPRIWRRRSEMYRLEGEVCTSCQEKIFPKRDVCPHCGDYTKTKFLFSGKGEVFSYTKVYDAPCGFEDQTPYTVALIKLDEGPMVTAQLTDLEQEPEIGMRVEMVTRKLTQDGNETGIIVYGYKFRPEMVNTNGKTIYEAPSIGNQQEQ